MMTDKPKRPNNQSLPPNFWQDKPLSELSHEAWEALCDGCAKCCLVKLVDAETEALHYTRLSCKLLDTQTCHCTDYQNRQKQVPDCLKITPENLPNMAAWLPTSCAYRLLHEGKELPDWHPLLANGPELMHQQGHSVQGKTLPETKASAAPEDYIWDEVNE